MKVTVSDDERRPSPLCSELLVTRQGMVFREDGSEPLQHMSDRGYLRVWKTFAGKRVFPVHRLVASAWCDGYSDGLVVNHKNGIKTDNRADNLEWVTQAENVKHSSAMGISPHGERVKWSRLKEADVIAIRGRLANGESNRAIEREYGMSSTLVSNIKTGKKWKHLLPKEGIAGDDDI